ITPATVTGAIAANDKVYDGTAAAKLSSQTLTGVIGADVVSLTVAAANFDTKNVGNNKTVTATGLGLTGADAGHYGLSSTTATTTANITARPITVTADAQTKVYGEADPALTYQVTSGNLASGDSFSGGLTRDAGENVGTYAIRQGALTAGGNYDLSYV